MVFRLGGYEIRRVGDNMLECLGHLHTLETWILLLADKKQTLDPVFFKFMNEILDFIITEKELKDFNL